jgi:hypothetical protein
MKRSPSWYDETVTPSYDETVTLPLIMYIKTSCSYRPLSVDNSTTSTNRKTEKNAECAPLGAQYLLVPPAGIFTTEMMTAETRAAEQALTFACHQSLQQCLFVCD